MLRGLPLADPQFWLVTAAVAGAAWLAVRRLRRRRAGPSACASCPKAPALVPPDRRS